MRFRFTNGILCRKRGGRRYSRFYGFRRYFLRCRFTGHRFRNGGFCAGGLRSARYALWRLASTRRLPGLSRAPGEGRRLPAWARTRDGLSRAPATAASSPPGSWRSRREAAQWLRSRTASARSGVVDRGAWFHGDQDAADLQQHGVRERRPRRHRGCGAGGWRRDELLVVGERARGRIDPRRTSGAR